MRILLIAALIAATPAAAGPFGDVAAVADAELAGMRGGFTLPNGVDIALTAQIDTAVNGLLILRSVLRLDDGPATIAVYAPAPGETGPPATLAPPRAPQAAAAPLLIIDRASGVTTVMPGAVTPGVTVNVASDAMRIGEAPPGLADLRLVAGAPGVETANGTVALIGGPGARVVLEGSTLTVTQLVGQALGTAIENTQSNRAIDSATWINLELGGAGVTVLSAAAAVMRVEDAVLDATRRTVF